MVTEKVLKEKLKEHFGHEEFRSGQADLIDAVLSGKDALGIMPTGGGKSVCYQLPAMLFGGITLIISPLISLMKDQIHSLKENGIAAAYINSTLSDTQIGLVLERAMAGVYKILYVAPERLSSPRFTEFCYNANIPFVAVDEAHCVSQWGQDFRPSYAAIPEFIGRFNKRPVVAAFTATATVRVREDIATLLKLKNPVVKISGFDRKNLFFEVRHPKKRYEELLKIAAERKGQVGIVYCATRKTVEEVCERLNSDGFNAARYHAGLSDTERHQNQEDFIYDKVSIIVATNAFGMGIDKENVSFVVHYNMPKDIESYYQEAGRAGRDGMNADCILLFSGQDVRTNLFLIENSEGRQYESEEQKTLLQSQERKRLKDVDLFCHTNSCLRNYILKYFGENPAEDCGNCGSCLKETEEIDITTAAQKILSCVARTKEFYGKNTVIEILRGSKNSKLLRAGLDRLPVYGICKESDAALKEIIHYLIEHGYLSLTNGQYPLMKLGERASEILRGQDIIKMPHVRDLSERDTAAALRGKSFGQPQNAELYKHLKELRRQIADEHGVPAYIVFHDRTLAEMSEVLPGSLDAFSMISGVGARKLEAYGEIFLQEIKAFAQEKGLPLAEGNSLPKPKATAYETETVDYGALDLSAVEIQDCYLSISEVAANINLHLMPQDIKKITAVTLNEWLTETGFIDTERAEGSPIKRKASAAGKEYGIREEVRTNARNQSYTALTYPPRMQQLLKENIAQILKFRDNRKAEG